MARYFRLQPKGLSLDHYSMDSSGDFSDGLHVFEGPIQLVCCDAGERAYGDEVVILEAPSDWNNGDVEGVCVDPAACQIVARLTWAEFLDRFFPGLPPRPRGRDYDKCLVDE